MKSEMVNLKVQLDSMSTSANHGNNYLESKDIKKERKYSPNSYKLNNVLGKSGLKASL